MIALIWLAFLGVAHVRMRQLATARPPALPLRVALGAVLCTVALALFAATVIF